MPSKIDRVTSKTKIRLLEDYIKGAELGVKRQSEIYLTKTIRKRKDDLDYTKKVAFYERKILVLQSIIKMIEEEG